MESESPQTFEERIINYLKGQEILGEDNLNQSFTLIDTIAPEEEVGIILAEIVDKVIKRVVCRDRYENIRLWHNQFPLFDLSHIIPDFCIDEEIMEKLSFKETVLISEIDTMYMSREVEPKAIGGLCLNIETVDGRIPEDREIPFEEQLEKNIAQILKRTKEKRTVITKNSEIRNEKSQWDKILDESLKNYETFLSNQMQQNCKKFVVHLSSQFEVDGRNAGSRLTSWVDRNFHTLEERKTEYIQDTNDSLDEKTIYIGLQKEKYFIHHKSNDLDDKKYYNLVKTKDLVCEGANFILMRYLALIKYTGTFELSTTYINGDLCRNIYDCIGSTLGIINDKEVEICKIYRYIIEECGIEHHCVTVLTVNGYIISQEWEGCNYILNRNPILFLGNGPLPYEREILAKTWTDDIELLSKFLDYKTEAEMKMKNYLFDHPEVKELFSDYINNILLLKPENILPFTMDYFQSLCPIKLPRQSYFESDDGDMYMF